ncbi:spherulin-2A-like [Ostrinia nubilalis]|uniref:spherulin-2A-like n=1 Tax=Ostrinia nubilalis TaxID=29057 RepID=UPI003082246D
MEKLILLLLPVLVSCSITVNIIASNSDATSRVNYIGTDSNIISAKERVTFGVTDENLKTAAEKYSGGRPKDVFLHSPTPWNDLYQTYGWRQVRRILRPIRHKILSVDSEDSVMSVKEMHNNSTATVSFNTGMQQDVENIVSNTWSKEGALTIEEPIHYDINFISGSVTGPDFKFSSKWANDAMEVKKITIGSDSDTTVPVEPGQSIKASLQATKVTMIAEIDYYANLNGHVACNYPKKFNGHHFWRYDVTALQEAGQLRKTVMSSEVIKIRYYSNPKLVITNKDTNEEISSHPGFLRDTNITEKVHA